MPIAETHIEPGTFDLPRYYGEDYLVLLPRDPYYIFSYWELSHPTRENCKPPSDAHGNAPFPVLRIYRHQKDYPDRIHCYFDREISLHNDNWYIKVKHPGAYYYAQWGWKTTAGDFVPVLQSNSVYTPRNSVSDIIDENWALPDWKFRKLYRRISMYHLSSPELVRRERELRGER